MTEADTKAQGGREDGSVAADCQVSAAMREVSDTPERDIASAAAAVGAAVREVSDTPEKPDGSP